MLTQVATHSAVATHPQEAKPRHFLSEGTRRHYRSPAWRPVFSGAVKIVDVVFMAGSALVANRLVPHGSDTDRFYLLAGLLGSLLAFLAITRGAAYSISSLQSFAAQAKLLLPGLMGGAIVQGVALWILQVPAGLTYGWPLVWLLSSATLMLALRAPLALSVRNWVRTGWLSRRVAVVGATGLGQRIAEHIAVDRNTSDQIVGIFDDAVAHSAIAAPNMRVSGRVADLVALSRRERVDAIVIALPASQFQQIEELRTSLRCLVADIYFASDICEAEDPVVSLGGSPVISLIRRPLTDWQRIQKAVLDRMAAGFLLVMFSPVLLLIATAIRLDSRGPILFRQPRMGFNNVPFTVFKFRSMYHDMADLLADRQTSRDDPRVTRVGRPLRKLSLDELPQLLNVIRGEMSLVGPRPHAPNTKAEGHLLEDASPTYADRHRIKPGITGWAQINGARGELRTLQELENRLQHDMYYIKNWNLLLDIKILWLTVIRELISSRAF